MVEKAKRGLKFGVEVLRAAGRRFGVVRANRMAAAIAYRTFFSLAPLLFLAVAVFGAVIGDDEQAQAEILSNIETFAGSQVAEAMTAFLGATIQVSGAAAIVGFILVLWTASSLFLEMQHDLDDIFGVPYEHTAGVVAFIKKRGKGFLWALGLGLVLVAVWVLNFAWRFVGGLFPAEAVGVHRVIAVLAPLVSLVLLPVLFALIIQSMTSISVTRRAVWYGASFTATVFLVAAYVIGLYFALDTTPSAFTVAGSVFIVLLMAFALSSVFLFGVCVTREYAEFLDDDATVEEDAPTADGMATVADAPPPVPAAAIAAFLGGLFVGRRRRR